MAPRLAVLGVTITVLLTHTPAAQGSARRGDRASVLVQRGLEKGKADKESPAKKLQQQTHDKKLAEMRAKYRKAALAGHGKTGSAATDPGATGKPALRRAAPRRRWTVPELAGQFKTDRPIIARYLMGAADINGDGLLSESERDWVTLEMARRQKKRLAAGPQPAHKGPKSQDQRARELRRRLQARKEARTGKRKSKIKVPPKPRAKRPHNAWDTWKKSATKAKPKR